MPLNRNTGTLISPCDDSGLSANPADVGDDEPTEPDISQSDFGDSEE